MLEIEVQNTLFLQKAKFMELIIQDILSFNFHNRLDVESAQVIPT